jgi:hypothetical protein
MNDLLVMLFLPIVGLLLTCVQFVVSGFLFGVGAILAAKVFKLKVSVSSASRR